MSQANEISTETPSKSRVEKYMIGFFKEKENALIAVIIALVIGALFTLLITEREIGLNYFLLSAALVAAVGWVMYKDDNLDVRKFAFWATVFLMYASVYFRLSNYTYIIFTTLLMPVLFVAVTIFSSKKMPSSIFVNAIIRFFGSIAFVDKIFIAIKSLTAKKEGSKGAGTWNIVAGIAASIIIVLIVVPLMFSADALFEKTVVDLIDLSKIGEFVWKSVLSAIVAILFFGFIYIITVKKDEPKADIKKESKKYNAESALMIVLCVVGALYTFFAVVQFSYLFGALKGALPEGYTHTEYARSGYFEQVAMTIINLSIIGVSILLTEKSEGALKKAINILLIYFIAVNFYLIVSSASKMNLYQQKYGFTVLRLLVDILLTFEALAFVLLIFKVINRKMRFIICALYFSAAFWAAVSFINIEGLSANLNLGRFDKGEEIDVYYLCSMEDVSSQVKYLYTDYYDSFSEEEIVRMERYFYLNTDEEKMEELLEVKPIEYNISKAQKKADAYEVLKIKNAK